MKRLSTFALLLFVSLLMSPMTWAGCGSRTVSISGGTSPPSTPPIGTNPVPIPGPRTDLRPDFDIYNTNGHEISSNCDDCSGEAVDVNQHVRPKLWTEVGNANAGNYKRKSSSDTIEGPIWWKIKGKTGWNLLGSGEYTIGKLDNGEKISETHDFNIPNYPGDIIQWRSCVDGDDEIWEEGETSDQNSISSPEDYQAESNNCSRIERNYIRIPNHPPTGAVDGGDCNGLSGWAKDQNTPDPLRIHIYANGAYVGQPLANQYRSDVGSHGFSWETPETFKDGSVRNLTFYAVDVPDGTETPIGSRTLVCSPPPSYDLATTATWIDGTYTLNGGDRFTIRGVVRNLGSILPNNATVTATLIHQGGTEYPMGSVTVLASNLLSGWNADVSISAIAPSQDGRYQLKTCVTANLQETDGVNNCLEIDGPFVPPIQNTDLSDDEEAAIWIINHGNRRRSR